MVSVRAGWVGGFFGWFGIWFGWLVGLVGRHLASCQLVWMMFFGLPGPCFGFASGDVSPETRFPFQAATVTGGVWGPQQGWSRGDRKKETQLTLKQLA